MAFSIKVQKSSEPPNPADKFEEQGLLKPMSLERAGLVAGASDAAMPLDKVSTPGLNAVMISLVTSGLVAFTVFSFTQFNKGS